jgi:hypothetical protein
MASLRTYLTHKLQTIPPKNTTQRVLICTWLTQLYLNALHDSEGNKDRRNMIHEELSHFLTDNKDYLDQKTTVELLASHGLTDFLLLYADLAKDHHLMLTHLTQNYVSGMLPLDRYRVRISLPLFLSLSLFLTRSHTLSFRIYFFNLNKI